MLSEYFWGFFVTAVCGFLLAVIRLLYKSKCEKVQLCCLTVDRDTTNEEKVDELRMQHPELEG